MTQEEKRFRRSVKLIWIRFYVKTSLIHAKHYLSLLFVIPPLIFGSIAITLFNIITLFKFAKYLIDLKDFLQKSKHDNVLSMWVHNIISHFTWIFWILVLLIALIVRIY